MTLNEGLHKAIYQTITQPFEKYNQFAHLALHLLYPNNIEYYLIGFEFEDSDGVITDRFILPMNPQSVTDPNKIIATVQKTAGGVNSMFLNGFVPSQIQMTGNFGMDFKTMVLNKKDYQELKKNTPKERWQSLKPFLSTTLFSGYGAYNALKYLFEKSKDYDSKGKPYKVIYSNLVFSQYYYVQFMDFQGIMSQDKNFVHNYTFMFQKIGVADNTVKKFLNKAVDNLKKNKDSVKKLFSSKTKITPRY